MWFIRMSLSFSALLDGSWQLLSLPAAGLPVCRMDFPDSQVVQNTVLRRAQPSPGLWSCFLGWGAFPQACSQSWCWHQPHLEAVPHLFPWCHLRLGLGLAWFLQGQLWHNLPQFPNLELCYLVLLMLPKQVQTASWQSHRGEWRPALASSLLFCPCCRAAGQETICNHSGIVWHQMSWGRC